MVFGSYNHLATFEERETIAAAFELTVARVVHIEDCEHMVHIVALSSVARSNANDGSLVNVVTLGAG